MRLPDEQFIEYLSLSDALHKHIRLAKARMAKSPCRGTQEFIREHEAKLKTVDKIIRSSKK